MMIYEKFYPHDQEMTKYITSSEWKWAAFGKGAMDKNSIIQAVKAHGYNPQTEDEADAIGMLIGFLNMER